MNFTHNKNTPASQKGFETGEERERESRETDVDGKWLLPGAGI